MIAARPHIRNPLRVFQRFAHTLGVCHKLLAHEDLLPETEYSVFKNVTERGATRMVRVKICCIASVAEAELAVRHGAAALGLVGRMPSGPGPIEDELIAEIAAWAPPAVATFLLTSETEPEAIADHVRRCGTSTVQLVDAVPPQAYEALRKAVPQLKIVQVIHVTGPESVDAAKACLYRRIDLGANVIGHQSDSCTRGRRLCLQPAQLEWALTVCR